MAKTSTEHFYWHVENVNREGFPLYYRNGKNVSSEGFLRFYWNGINVNGVEGAFLPEWRKRQQRVSALLLE